MSNKQKITKEERAALCAWLDACDPTGDIEQDLNDEPHIKKGAEVAIAANLQLARLSELLGWAVKMCLPQFDSAPTLNMVMWHKQKIIDFLISPNAIK